jgi:hypothetical protein
MGQPSYLTAESKSGSTNYSGNRAILLDAADGLPDAELRHCVGLALTYHLGKRKAK